MKFFFISIIVFPTILFGQDKLKTEQNVLFHSADNDTSVEIIAVNARDREFSDEPIYAEKGEHGNIAFSFPLNNPQLFYINAVKPPTGIAYVYITPGDTIAFKRKETTIVFEGKNAAHYNFFNNFLSPEFKYPIYDKNEGITGYKKECEKVYQRRKYFLEEYVEKEKVSPFFIAKISDALWFQYLDMLLNRFTLPKGALYKYPEYLSEIDIKIFNNDNMLDYYPFKSALTNYLFQASASSVGGKEDYSKERLAKQLDLIDKNLSGDVRQYAFTRVFLNFCDSISIETINPLKNAYKIYLPQITNRYYKQSLENAYKGLAGTNASLPDDVLNVKLIDLEGNTFTLKEVLEQQGEKIKVIDFWASWCSPCIRSIRESNDYKQKLAKKDKVRFLYVSIDKEPSKWKKMIAELKSYGMDKNQYLIDEATGDYLKNFFSVSSIPKYILLDSENKMALSDAPSPADKSSFEKEIERVGASK
ncbi:MAG: TlpA family protein disulfide reductase [Flavobacterium sp.]